MDLHLKAGLVRTNDDYLGQPQYIGTKKQWDDYEELEEEKEEQENEETLGSMDRF